MADIFISYAREDIHWASNLAQAVKSYGWSTWWDPEIPPGEEYDRIIENELSAASCVVVGWSSNSIKSRWVKDEAQEAHEQGKLFPILIDDAKPPIGFRRFQNTDLRSWDGTINSPLLVSFIEQIEKKIGPAPNQNVILQEYQRTIEFFTHLLDYDTGLITTIVKIKRRSNKIVAADIICLNPRACRFYDLSANTTNISGEEIIKKLRCWINANDLKALQTDQERLFDNLLLGRECMARIPLRINNRHPHKDYQDQQFMPFIFAFSGKFAVAEHVEELIAVTYINLSRL